MSSYMCMQHKVKKNPKTKTAKEYITVAKMKFLLLERLKLSFVYLLPCFCQAVPYFTALTYFQCLDTLCGYVIDTEEPGCRTSACTHCNA